MVSGSGTESSCLLGAAGARGVPHIASCSSAAAIAASSLSSGSSGAGNVLLTGAVGGFRRGVEAPLEGRGDAAPLARGVDAPLRGVDGLAAAFDGVAAIQAQWKFGRCQKFGAAFLASYMGDTMGGWHR